MCCGGFSSALSVTQTGIARPYAPMRLQSERPQRFVGSFQTENRAKTFEHGTLELDVRIYYTPNGLLLGYIFMKLFPCRVQPMHP